MQNTTSSTAGWPQYPQQQQQQRSTSGQRYEGGDYQYNAAPAAAANNNSVYYDNQTAYPRRTSNPKTSTPPTYPREGFPPTSAPPQISSHHSVSQPQTAHPYGNYYQQGYYEPQYYMRQGSSQAPQTPLTNDRPNDYSPGYNYDRNYQRQYYPQQWQQQQQPWQGQYYPQQSAPAPTVPPPAPEPIAVPAEPIPAPVKKGKKEKEPKVDLKRKETDDEEDKGSKKKKKKEKEVKEEPKVQAKSHLHPPRQAQSAWQLFFTDELNKAKALAAANQGRSPGGTLLPIKLNVAQIAKDAGAAYAALDDEQKKHYAEKVQESKDHYAIELAAWQKTLTPEDIRLENAFRAQQRKDGKSRKGNLKDPNAPKKPLSAYFLFLKGIREDDALRARVWGEETETTKQSVLAAERWRGLSDDEKKPYLQQAEKDKAEYEEARKLYESDAAAKARGEDVPTRSVNDPTKSHVEPPASLKDKASPFDQFASFPEIEMDSLVQEGQWDDLSQLIGKKDEFTV